MPAAVIGPPPGPAKRKPSAAEALQSFTKPDVIPLWNAEDWRFASWLNNVLDLEIQASLEAADRAFGDDEEAQLFAGIRAAQAALVALSTPVLIEAVETEQPLSGPQRARIVDCLKNEGKPKPKRKRGRPKGSGPRSLIHAAGADVDRIKKILQRYCPKQKGIPARALELAASFWGFDPTTVENFRKSPRWLRSPARK